MACGREPVHTCKHHDQTVVQFNSMHNRKRDSLVVVQHEGIHFRAVDGDWRTLYVVVLGRSKRDNSKLISTRDDVRSERERFHIR